MYPLGPGVRENRDSEFGNDSNLVPMDFQKQVAGLARRVWVLAEQTVINERGVERVVGGIVGLTVGDALGYPHEFHDLMWEFFQKHQLT